MFEDSLMESGGKIKTKQGATTTISFILQILLIGVLVLLPLIFTEALPKQQLMTFLVAPPPPPPPPPPAAIPEIKIVKPQRSRGSAKGSDPAARACVAGRVPRSVGEAGKTELSSAGAPGAYSGDGRVAGGHQQRRFY